MPRAGPHNLTAALATGGVLVAIFSILVIWLRTDMRDEIHLKIVERDAAVLYPMALQQLADSDSASPGGRQATVSVLLKAARQVGMLAVAVFDSEGNTVDAVPATQLFVELPAEDYLRLQTTGSITRFRPAFPLDQYFAGISQDQRQAPVLEVLLALPGPRKSTLRGFVRYYIDARPLASELALIDRRIDRQTGLILAVGALLIVLVMAGAMLNVQRAQRIVAERNERLTRANFELTLAAKASAIGQIASHLIHGMQGSVEGLRSFVAARDVGQGSPHWHAASDYAERLQRMIRDTVALLSDTTANASYEYSGDEIAELVRTRHAAAAAAAGIVFTVENTLEGIVDSHRGSLLCLIAHNLVQNAITATPAGARVSVRLEAPGVRIRLTVRDEGIGIPDDLRDQLFQPGRSGRPGGSGLGLALSRLLARQIGAELTLERTGPDGTLFAVELPRQPQSAAG
ncbi:MAG TPA: sensor histidine kinase [Candidatus Didemnitutus sp.]|jgi:signal transduction histidine kinase